MTGYFNVILVLQSCSDSLHILPSSSRETNATSSDCACHIGNVKVEKDFDMQEGEELNLKTEKHILCGEEGCIGIKHEKGRYSEEEEEDVGVKEDVSLEGSV